MPDVKEVYEMVTKQKPPEPGALERQRNRQRRAARNRKAGVIALVAALLVGLGVFVLVHAPGKNHVSITSNSPSVPGQALSIVDIGSGGTTTFKAPLGASRFDYTLDGSMVTYTDVDENGNDQIFVMDADGSNQRQLTHGVHSFAHSGFPLQWSPNGTRIAYWISLPGSGVELFVVNVSDGASTRVTHEPTDVYEGGWASDRSFVFSISNPSSDYPLLARSIDLDTEQTRTIAWDANEPQVSPDGTQIAFDAYFRPQREAWLCLKNVDGNQHVRKIKQVGYAGSYPKWSPDSTQIAYVDDSAKGGSGTYVYDLETGETRFVTDGTVESWIDDDHILVS
jgi:Tol biopolymer transport system component